MRELLVGGGLLLLGIVITSATYQSARDSGGGHYMIAYGPMVVGGISMVRGLIHLAGPMPAIPQPARAIRGFPLSLQVGSTQQHGHIFLVAGRLYFVGLSRRALAAPTLPAPPIFSDEAALWNAVARSEGGFAVTPPEVQAIDPAYLEIRGEMLGLPNGLAPDLRAALATWGRYHDVRTIGMA